MSEIYSYSKANVATREASVRRQGRQQLFVALLFVLALCGAWSYQTMTGVSVVDVWQKLSGNVRTAIVISLIVVAGMVFMARDLFRADE